MAIRAGFIGVIGQANAGKSTLVNALVGEKVSIVTHKPQTTRQRISGIYTSDKMQAVFLDAPGVVHSEAGLNKFLGEEYTSVIQDSDALIGVLNIDAKKQSDIEEVIDLCQKSGKPWIAAVSKVDTEKHERKQILLNLLQELQVPVVEISAKNKPQAAQDKLLPFIEIVLPMSPAPLYDKEISTTHNLRELAGETIREKCFYYLHQEVPYGMHVKVQKYEEVSPRFTRIYADLIVSKEGHKSMVVGKQGAMLKRIGQASREELEKRYGVKIYLELHVTVKTQWMKNKKAMKETGYAKY